MIVGIYLITVNGGLLSSSLEFPIWFTDEVERYLVYSYVKHP